MKKNYLFILSILFLLVSCTETDFGDIEEVDNQEKPKTNLHVDYRTINFKTNGFNLVYDASIHI